MRILVVVDDPLNRMFLCAVLEAAGYTVRTVTDGMRVLAEATEFEPHLVTMDINLPNVSGVEVINRLRAELHLERTPILAITAYVGKGEEARVRAAGASEYMAKPLSIRPLLRCIERLLREAGNAEGVNVRFRG